MSIEDIKHLGRIVSARTHKSIKVGEELSIKSNEIIDECT